MVGTPEGRLELSAGLDAGEPLPEADDLYGTTAIVAGRLCEAAGPGQILASAVVCQVGGSRLPSLVGPPGPLRLRGIAQRVSAAEVRWREEEGPEPPEPAGTVAQRNVRVVIADDSADRITITG